MFSSPTVADAAAHLGRAALKIAVAACLTAAIRPVAARAQTPALIVLVRDATTTGPVSGVRISLDHTPLPDTTGADGIARIAHADPGPHLVNLRRMGYRPDSQSVTITAAASATVEVVLTPAATALPRVDVTAPAYDSRLEGFMRRRAKGGAFFFTEQELDSSNTRSLDQLLRAHSTALLVPGPGGQMFLASHSAQLGFGGRPCWVQVVWDGVVVYNPLSIQRDRSPPDLRGYLSRELAAVEFYPSPNSTPVQFRSGAPACGTLVLWSRLR